MSGCPTHSYSVEPRHKKPEHYDDCAVCRKAWDGHLRRNRWKRSERKSAALYGERRNPGSGAITPGNPGDSTKMGLIGEFFSVKEHRQRKTWDVPGWWREVMAEAKGGHPLLTLSKPDEKGELAVLDSAYLADLLKELSELRQTLQAGFKVGNGLIRRDA